MQNDEVALYDMPSLYDAVVPPGPCEGFYRSIANLTGGPVLELACGTGRLLVPVAADGHDVVGLDISPQMLRAARRKAEAAGVQIEFLERDLRSFELGRAFALVIVSCNSLSHLTTNHELVGALQRISRHLAPSGLFAFDIINPRISDLARAGRMNVDLDLLGDGSAVKAIEELLSYDSIGQVRVLRLQITGDPQGLRRTQAMRLRAIFPQELQLLLAAAGLELVARYGDFEGNPLTGDSFNQVCLTRLARERVCLG